MPTPITRVRRAAALISAVLTVLGFPSGSASAQTGFKVTHEVGTASPNQVEVKGTVQNEGRAEALDVSVTVDALGAGNKVLARGITFVSPAISPGSTASFVAKVPVVPGTVGYRARVTSFRFLQQSVPATRIDTP